MATSADRPPPALRAIGPHDHAVVLDLNRRHVPEVSPVDDARLTYLLGLADRADLVDVGGAAAGFVVTLRGGTGYDSENYRAFAERYGDDFYYLDRIVIDVPFRRQGLGRFVYDELESTAAAHPRFALEVNVAPPNPASMAFHLGRGFVVVGELGDGDHRVALLVKEPV